MRVEGPHRAGAHRMEDRGADVARRLRKLRPDISISSDFIIGFPGETEKDFLDTYNFLNEFGLRMPNLISLNLSNSILKNISNIGISFKKNS